MDILYSSRIVNNQFITPQEASEEPVIKYKRDSGLYTLLMDDPDASVGNYIHWVIVNIPGSQVKKADVLVDYEGPGPPKGTGKHRYQFSLFQQREKIPIPQNVERINALEDLYKKLGLEGEKPIFEAEFLSEYTEEGIGGSNKKKKKTQYKKTKKYNLTRKDYRTILQSYNEPIPKKNIEKKVEKVLASKLCRCIKKVGDEPRSIGICSGTIFNRRNLTRGKFQCKKERKVTFTKKNRKPLK